MDRRAFLAAAAAAPFALSTAPARARLLGAPTLVLVTADLESHVVAVDPVRRSVVARVPTGHGPRSIETVGGTTAVVAHTAHGLVSLLDGPSLRVRAVVAGFEQPRYTAADPAGRLAYVTDSGRGDVAVLDVVRGEVLARTELGGPARHVSLDPSGAVLWVALGSKAREVVAVDVRDRRRPRVAARVHPPYLAHDVHFTATARSVWVTSGDRGTIGIFDPVRRDLLTRITADAPPQHVAFIGGRAYVTSGASGTLRVHDAAGGRLEHTAPVPVGSYNVQQDRGVVATPSLSRGTLCLFGTGGELESELTVARSSHDACFVTG
jgi:DNA-binding beta-propeller fold protein YncE